MHYYPKPFETREETRAKTAAAARLYSQALWAVDDAEAQLRWARAYKQSPEHIAALEQKLTEAYAQARTLAL